MKSRAEYRRHLKKELQRLLSCDLCRLRMTHLSSETREITAQVLKERGQKLLEASHVGR